MVRSEHACSARHGHGFSLITFESSTRAAEAVDLSGLVQHAASLLRATDLIGWMGPDKVLVLLPFASRERAQEVAEFLLEDGAWQQRGITHTVECHGSAGPRVVIDRSAPTRTGAPPDGALPADVSWEEGGVPLLLFEPLPRWKRALDVALAALGLVVLSPLIALIALLIRTSSRGPVIYKQWRTGAGFRRFQIYKFRTMRQSSRDGWDDVKHLNEMSGPLFKSSKDPRVLRLGKLLRKTSLDELPQLVNVLRGDMTLIGPRALSPQPGDYEPWQLRRFDVTPGIACDWQAEKRSETDFDEWMRSDLRYVERGRSFAGDAKLFWTTVRTVLRCAGSR